MRFLLLPFSILFLLCYDSLVYSKATPSNRTQQAKRHLERANEFEAWDDPRAEQEYKLAIRARNGRYPEALQKLRWHLQRNLRFQEAATYLARYIQQTPREDHTDDFKDLEELRHAAAIRQRIDTSAKPKLNDLIEYISIVSDYGASNDAMSYAEKAVKLYPTSAETYLLLARLLRGTQNERQLWLLQKAAELEPDNPEIHSGLGWYYFTPGRKMEKAVEEFRKALDLSSGQMADAWQGLGHVLTIQGKKKEAVEAFRNYLKNSKSATETAKEVERLIEQLERSPQT